MRPLHPYVGGKWRMAKWIISHFPPAYKMYVEPFAGTGAVLLSLRHNVEREVLNDADDSILNLMEVARTQPELLAAHLTMLPYSRQLYRRWRYQYLKHHGSWLQLTDLERAVQFYYLMHTTFSGWLSMENAGFHHHHKTTGPWAPATFRRALDNIPQAAERLGLVQLECMDFEKVIRKYDGPETLFYCDPPYGGTRHFMQRHNQYYARDWTEDDTRRLAALLTACDARVVLSDYDTPLLNELYGGWRRDAKDVHVSSDFHHQTGSRRQEVLLMNYAEDGTRLQEAL